MQTREAIKLTIGHSPDADDAFMWWPLGTEALTQGPAGARKAPPTLDLGPYHFTPITQDIEALNQRALTQGDLDITAVSMFTYARLRHRYHLTSCGASFGEGYGPKVLANPNHTLGDGPQAIANILRSGGTIATPGLNTTAGMVLCLIAHQEGLHLTPEDPRLIPMRFDQVIPAIQSGQVTAGLVIHEAQVTYAQDGLSLLQDLGIWWQQTTQGLPLPLGANVIRADLDTRFGTGTLDAVGELLHQSVVHALAHRDGGLEYAMAFAQDSLGAPTDPAASADQRRLVDHFIELYVNDLSVDLGDRGTRAVQELITRGAAANLIPTDDSPPKIKVIGPS